MFTLLRGLRYGGLSPLRFRHVTLYERRQDVFAIEYAIVMSRHYIFVIRCRYLLADFLLTMMLHYFSRRRQRYAYLRH